MNTNKNVVAVIIFFMSFIVLTKNGFAKETSNYDVLNKNGYDAIENIKLLEGEIQQMDEEGSSVFLDENNEKETKLEEHSANLQLENNIESNTTEINQEEDLLNDNGMIPDEDKNHSDFSDGENTTSEPAKDNDIVENLIEEIDIGDYRTEMLVGEKQLLIVTPIPQNTGKKIYYSSSDELVAKINGLGRITALSVGKTQISIECDQIREEFTLNVISQEKEEIEVESIEVANFESEMFIDDMQTLTVAYLPLSASNANLSFSSADSNIVTINSFGEIKALSKGDTEITISAGNVIKSLPISVKVKTENIQVGKTTVFLKPGERYTIEASVCPVDADQVLTYESTNEDILGVLDNTVIAKAIGEASVVISNGEISTSVVFIINDTYSLNLEENTYADSSKEYELNKIERSILSSLAEADTSEVAQDLYPIISKAILRELYENRKMLILKGEEYSILLHGKDIVNFESKFNTNFEKRVSNDGMYLYVNDTLPGKITLIFENDNPYSYIFLHNEITNKYERIEKNELDSICIDLSGEYLFSNHDINKSHFNKDLAIAIAVMTIIGTCIFIIARHRYWFW